jgi:hypothetical protein
MHHTAVPAPDDDSAAGPGPGSRRTMADAAWQQQRKRITGLLPASEMLQNPACCGKLHLNTLADLLHDHASALPVPACLPLALILHHDHHALASSRVPGSITLSAMRPIHVAAIMLDPDPHTTCTQPHLVHPHRHGQRWQGQQQGRQAGRPQHPAPTPLPAPAQQRQHPATTPARLCPRQTQSRPWQQARAHTQARRRCSGLCSSWPLLQRLLPALCGHWAAAPELPARQPAVRLVRRLPPHQGAGGSQGTAGAWLRHATLPAAGARRLGLMVV